MLLVHPEHKLKIQSMSSKSWFDQMLLVHPEHKEADEDERAKEGKEVEAMPSEVEPLQIRV